MSADRADRSKIGFIAIGRNEGERLERCLESVRGELDRIVYVDSGSEDQSVAFARGLGAEVVELDPSKPFTAARGRNEGFDHLIAKWPDTELIIFFDGDCSLADGFIDAAANALRANAGWGIVVGRVREIYPDATVYNRLCDLEWQGPVGEIHTSGGRFMIRKEAFAKAGGFNPAVIAAEDDEFCIRVRREGYTIHRIEDDMCFHDAAMTSFSQWWRRSVRAGYGYAHVGSTYRDYFRPERARAWAWGLGLPLAALILAPFTFGLSLLLFGLYPLSFVRTRANLKRDGAAARDATIGAAFLTISKFPNLAGMLDYWRKRAFGQAIAIVEYK
ncbi:MAG: glycosyltransferase family 2 protein [Pseudomonadota bacterium]